MTPGPRTVLTRLLAKAGAPRPLICKIAAQDGDVRANPYETLRRAGGTIDVADRVAVHLKFPLAKRILGHAEWFLAQRPLHKNMLVARIQFSTEMPQTTVTAILEKLLRKGDLMALGSQIVPVSFYKQNMDVVGAIKTRVEHAFPNEALAASFARVSTLTTPQRAALDMVARHRVSIITGGPGTGKSHVVREMMAAHPTARVTAPTGRAARNVSGKTVHYFKTIQETGKNDLRDADLVAIEEASMLSTDLFWAVLTMAPASAHIVLIGDVDQLPPIDAGEVLRDLMPHVPVTALDVNIRSTCGIQDFARDILQGRVELASGVELLPCDTLTDAIGFLATFEADDDESVMVLTPHNKTRIELNKALQLKRWASEDEIEITLVKGFPDAPPGTRGIARMFPAEPGTVRARADNTTPFACSLGAATSLIAVDNRAGGIETEAGCVMLPGDKVIVTKNTATGACNGDVGTYVHPNAIRYEDKTIEIPPLTDKDPGMTLAYCTTVHKAQGSEFDTVVLPITNVSAWDRPLLYTAVTRAKRKVILLGTKDDLEKIVRTAPPPRPSILNALFS